LNFTAKKLIAIITTSNELLNDVPMLEAHIRRVFGAEMGFKLDLAVLAGSVPAGQPQGMLNSPSLITGAKVTGQAPKTILAENINAMWKRLPAPSRKRAVWLINEEAEEQLDQVSIAIGTAAIPAPFYQQGPHDELPRLKGRPLVTLEQCP